MPALGKIGSADLVAGATTLIGGAFDEIGIVNMNLTNRGTTATLVRIAVGSGASPGLADWIEYDTELGPKKVLERTGFVVSIGEKVWIYSSLAGVSARVHSIAAQ